MINELIAREFQSYVFQEERLKKTLDRERGKLEQYAQKDNASTAYLSRQNRLLAAIWDYIEATGALLDGIATAQQIAAGQTMQQQHNSYEQQRLQDEVFKLKAYLRSLGKDPELVQFMTVRDFTHY